MIAYLLDEMPEAEREAFVERWFTDPELYQQLRMVEAGLVDDYVRGQLSEARRRQVEQLLLTSESQKRKLAFAEALRAALPAQTRAPLRWPLLGAAAALLIAAAGLSSWLGFQNRRLQREVSRLESGTKSPAVGIYTLDIPADTFRGGSSIAGGKLTPGAGILRLELELRPGDENRMYSATVLAGGRLVWSEGPLRPESLGAGHVARVWIPASALVPGDYTVRLDSGGNPVSYFSFSLAPR